MKIQILQRNQIQKAAKLLKQGGLVAFPTETVYGLGSILTNEESIQKIYKVKKRPQNNPLIAHVASISDCEGLGDSIPEIFFSLAKKFFPGPLTLIVKKSFQIPSIVSGGLDTIAIRMPNHPIALQLISEVGTPLVAPSANLSGKPSSTTAEHVVQDFEQTIDAVIDAGPTLYGIESTVIDLVSFANPTIVRLGALKREKIEEECTLKLDVYSSGEKTSPGMLYRHYAPKATVRVFFQIGELLAYLKQKKHSLILSTSPISHAHLLLRAQNLYSHLRLADEKGYEEIAIFCQNTSDDVLLNRLEKIVHESNCH